VERQAPQDPLQDSGGPPPLRRLALDPAAIDGDECELGGDEEPRSQDQEDDGKQAEGGLDRRERTGPRLTPTLRGKLRGSEPWVRTIRRGVMALDEQPVGENRRERRLLVAEAGFSQVSFISVLSGVLVAYGAFAVLAAIVGGTLDAIGVEFDVGNYDWETVGGIGTAVIGLALFAAYFFGGYVAGRMAFRGGMTHGLLVFVLGVVVAGLVGLFIGAIAGTDTIEENLRNVGVPTTADEWGAVGTIAGIVSLVVMLGGAVYGGIAGERWHTKLRRRAASVAYGPDAVDPDRAQVERPAAVPATTPTPVAPDDDMTAEERMRRAAEQSEQARVASERTRPVSPADEAPAPTAPPAANVG
jgi:hypothetical protein